MLREEETAFLSPLKSERGTYVNVEFEKIKGELEDVIRVLEDGDISNVLEGLGTAVEKLMPGLDEQNIKKVNILISEFIKEYNLKRLLRMAQIIREGLLPIVDSLQERCPFN
ncbi:MAG: hypothetical protein N2645_15980 [Clostridia bacterium]|nr:hypothetical protein [Clostridia bacterium]